MCCVCACVRNAAVVNGNMCVQAEVVWVQEEPLNMGAWSYVEPRLRTTANSVGVPVRLAEVPYLSRQCVAVVTCNVLISSQIPIGRHPSAATATGVPARHKQELRDLLNRTFA